MFLHKYNLKQELGENEELVVVYESLTPGRRNHTITIRGHLKARKCMWDIVRAEEQDAMERNLIDWNHKRYLAVRTKE